MYVKSLKLEDLQDFKASQSYLAVPCPNKNEAK